MIFLPKNYDLEAAWKKISRPFEHPDFVTHANYLHFMSENSEGLKLICRLNINKKVTLDKRVKQKIKLIELTLENLIEEKGNIDKYPDYSVVCVSWIPVKSYYLIFNLLILIEYLITASDSYLTITHSALFNCFRGMLGDKKVFFNKDLFNEICAVGDIEKWQIPPWENVKKNTANPELRYKQIIKKLMHYSKDEFKRMHKIKRLSGEKKIEFENTKINICEFLYWYRIKANYRDMEFVDKGVEVRDFVGFYTDYYNLSMNFYSAMKDCINTLATKRANQILLN